MSKDRVTIKVTCRDRVGLIATLANFLSNLGINVLDSQQHTESGMFFQRLHCDTEGIIIGRKELLEKISKQCRELNMDYSVSFEDSPKKVAIFVSSYLHCLYDLLQRQADYELPCEVSAIISNHLAGAKVAEQFGIPYHFIPIAKDDKKSIEARQREILRELEVDTLVLARYMQILSADFVREYPMHIINIHHGFLPAFSGSRPYHQAYEYGVKIIGATAHYATEVLDDGPVIAQSAVACSHVQNPRELMRRGRAAEQIALSDAVRAHLEDRTFVHGRRVTVL